MPDGVSDAIVAAWAGHHTTTIMWMALATTRGNAMRPFGFPPRFVDPPITHPQRRDPADAPANADVIEKLNSMFASIAEGLKRNEAF
jgi:hypothetical protein